MCIIFLRCFALSSCILLFSLQFQKNCNSFNFVASSKAHFLNMSNDDSDGGESLMHVVCPPILKPSKLSMLHLWHMDQGKEKGKTLLPNTYVLLWYSLEEW